MVAANTPKSWLTVCSLADFVTITLAAVRTVGTSGRFGRKVYVSALAGALGVNPGEALDLFKRRLFDAHRAQFLVLSRADLVAAMNPEAVELSTITVSGAEFHFVADPSAESLWAVEYMHDGDETVIVVPGDDADDAACCAEIRLSSMGRFPSVLSTPRTATDSDIAAHSAVLSVIERAKLDRAIREEGMS